MAWFLKPLVFVRMYVSMYALYVHMCMFTIFYLLRELKKYTYEQNYLSVNDTNSVKYN